MGRWTQSLVSFYDTPWYFSSEKKKSCENYTNAFVQSRISRVPFYSSVICWSLIHVTLWLQDPQVRMIKEKQKWLCPSSLCNRYIICPKACLFLPSQPKGSCIHHLSYDRAVAQHFYNEMPVRWQIRPLSYLSVSGFAPWKLEAWIQSTWQLSQVFL